MSFGLINLSDQSIFLLLSVRHRDKKKMQGYRAYTASLHLCWQLRFIGCSCKSFQTAIEIPPNNVASNLLNQVKKIPNLSIRDFFFFRKCLRNYIIYRSSCYYCCNQPIAPDVVLCWHAPACYKEVVVGHGRYIKLEP